MIDEYKKNKEDGDKIEDSGQRARTPTDGVPTIEITDPDNPESDENENEKAKEVLDDAGDQI